LRRLEGKLPSMGLAGKCQEWRNKAIAPYGPGEQRRQTLLVASALELELAPQREWLVVVLRRRLVDCKGRTRAPSGVRLHCVPGKKQQQ